MRHCRRFVDVMIIFRLLNRVFVKSVSPTSDVDLILLRRIDLNKHPVTSHSTLYIKSVFSRVDASITC